MEHLEFYILLLFVIVGALVAVETKHLLSAVICIGAAGFGSALMFLFLRAPDIAITQIVVEVLALVILIRVAISRKKTFISGDWELVGVIFSVGLLLIIFLAGTNVFDDLPEFGSPSFIVNQNTASQHYIQDAVSDTGATNLVTSVILDYRAYDTLGEATVLFTAVLGAIVILRKQSKEPQEPSP
jgi:multisubunit Na+/H+ antiporter MnhB subunit